MTIPLPIATVAFNSPLSLWLIAPLAVASVAIVFVFHRGHRAN